MPMTPIDGRRIAVVTGASSGIGYELAAQFAQNGFDLPTVAEDPRIQEAAQRTEQYDEAEFAVGCLCFSGAALLGAVQANYPTPSGWRPSIDGNTQGRLGADHITLPVFLPDFAVRSP